MKKLEEERRKNAEKAEAVRRMNTYLEEGAAVPKEAPPKVVKEERIQPQPQVVPNPEEEAAKRKREEAAAKEMAELKSQIDELKKVIISNFQAQERKDQEEALKAAALALEEKKRLEEAEKKTNE